MIRHTILFKVKSNVTQDDINDALFSMNELKNKLNNIFAIHTDECHFHDEKSKDFFMHHMQGVSHAISIDFVDQNALDNFFANPITVPAKNKIVNIAENGYQGIIGYDLENVEI
jgi:hypothetical protein